MSPSSSPPSSPPARHRLLLVILGALTAFGSLSVDMILPSLPTLAHELHGTPAHAQATLGAFLAGFSLGMLVYAPLSDRFGRRKVVLTGIFTYLAASIACMVAPDLPLLVSFRFVQALGGGAAAVLARTIARDVWPAGESARVLSQILAISMVAPLVSPSIGALLLQWWGWRALFAFHALFALVSALVVLFQVPETLPAHRRTPLGPMAVLLNYLFLLRQRQNNACLLMVGGSYGGMFAYLAEAPFLYIHHFGLTPVRFSQVLACGIVALTTFALANGPLARRLGSRTMLAAGCLLTFVAGAGGLALHLAGIDQLAALMAPGVLLVGMIGLTFGNAAAVQMSLFPAIAGACAGLLGAVQFGSGILFSSIAASLHDGSARGATTGMAVAGTLCLTGWLLSLSGSGQRNADGKNEGKTAGNP